MSRRRGAGDPLNYSALNVALYGAGGKRWALTERRRGSVTRTADALAIGPSTLTWDGESLTIAIDEIAVPIPARLRGTVRVYPRGIVDEAFALDRDGRHQWQPIGPGARIEVTMQQPALSWSGTGYFDINSGSEPLEDCFERWDWSCARLKEGSAILYDVTYRDGATRSLALRFDGSGAAQPFTPPQCVALPATGWGIRRRTRSEGSRPSVEQTLEDGPFYARSVLRGRLLGEDTTAMHESLSLARFRQRWVQALLPFRMPRALR